jgi:hypothetical protein
MKILNVLLIALFLYSTAVQYNDPDPYVWMPIYMYGAVLCLLALRGKYNPALYVIGLLTYGSMAVYYFVADNGVLDWITAHNAESLTRTMEAQKPWIEQTREFFGLTILAATLTANMVWLAKAKRTAVSQLWQQLLQGEILKKY